MGIGRTFGHGRFRSRTGMVRARFWNIPGTVSTVRDGDDYLRLEARVVGVNDFALNGRQAPRHAHTRATPAGPVGCTVPCG